MGQVAPYDSESGILVVLCEWAVYTKVTFSPGSMAIQEFSDKAAVQSSDFEGLFVGLNNGDRTALEQVLARWKFRGTVSFLKFVIAVMLKAEGSKLTIQVGGNQTGVTPNEDLLEPRP